MRSSRNTRITATYIPVRDICLDSAHDNYVTYGLCRKWNIRPFIDLNTNRERPDSIPNPISIDKDGTPLCMAGFRMANWGYCKQKHSRKWRCPLACGKVGSCPCKEKCSPSPYGRCIYTKPDWDIRLYTPVPRGTGEYKEIYNNRTSYERVNNRVLNDYHLRAMGIHTKKRYSFAAMSGTLPSWLFSSLFLHSTVPLFRLICLISETTPSPSLVMSVKFVQAPQISIWLKTFFIISEKWKAVHLLL